MPLQSSIEALQGEAERLCGGTVERLEDVGGGGNSRVYRIVSGGTSYALKRYPAPGNDPRDRLRQEFEALRFVAQHLPGRVPAAIGYDTAARLALYEWIDGEPIVPQPDDLRAAVDFAAALHALRDDPAATLLPRASEAIFGNADLLEQLDARFARLRAHASGEPRLQALLDAVAAELELRRGLDPAFATLEPAQRTLSPSDFGFHNALRRADGGIVFLDFEYFGWDDPVKLAADFVWHPAMALRPEARRWFAAAIAKVYAADPAFGKRLRAYEPLIALRWIAIVLNEFLPAVWERRRHGAGGGSWAAAKQRQLSKAEALLARLQGERS